VPYVVVTVQMVLSGPDVYNLVRKSRQQATASNSFDQVMAYQGIHVQSQLLGARVTPPPHSQSSLSCPFLLGMLLRTGRILLSTARSCLGCCSILEESATASNSFVLVIAYQGI